MRLNSRLILSLLAVIPSTLAAVNGKCSNGKKGICIATGTCSKYKGSTSNGNCPYDPNNIKCCSNIPCKANGKSGSCIFTDECKAIGGTTYSGLCPGGNNFKCCVPPPKKTTPKKTTPKKTTVKKTITKTQKVGIGKTCYGNGKTGICVDVSVTNCSGDHIIAGDCPGASAGVMCCVKQTEGVPSTVGWDCSGNFYKGRCIDTKKTECDGILKYSTICKGTNEMCCMRPIPVYPTPRGDN